jgi:hypothetical protein
MEPTSVISAVLKAAELIKKIRDEAIKWPPEDARYYGAWINVAGDNAVTVRGSFSAKKRVR